MTQRASTVKGFAKFDHSAHEPHPSGPLSVGEGMNGGACWPGGQTVFAVTVLTRKTG